VSSFETGEYTAVEWVDGLSGDFVTASTKAGTLKMWNAASKETKEIIKVVPQGIVTMVRLPGSEAVVLAQLKNGQVVLYNIRKKKLLFQSEVAHSAQV
jgi:hypothetical protein